MSPYTKLTSSRSQIFFLAFRFQSARCFCTLFLQFLFPLPFTFGLRRKVLRILAFDVLAFVRCRIWSCDIKRAVLPLVIKRIASSWFSASTEFGIAREQKDGQVIL